MEQLSLTFPMRYPFQYEAEYLLAEAGIVVRQRSADDNWSAYGTKLLGALSFMAWKME